MPARIHPIVDGEAEIVQVQLHQGGLQISGIAQLFSECVSLEFKFAAEQRREERQKCIVRRKNVRCDNVESDEYRLAIGETESVVQRLIFEQQVENHKHEHDVDLLQTRKKKIINNYLKY